MVRQLGGSQLYRLSMSSELVLVMMIFVIGLLSERMVDGAVFLMSALL
jgi:hypothetical protein